MIRALELTVSVALTVCLFAATRVDVMAAGWLRGDRIEIYRAGFAIGLWVSALGLLALRTTPLRRILLGFVAGFLASALSQFVVVPLVEGRGLLLVDSVGRFGVEPALLAPVVTFGWVAGALALSLAEGLEALRRRRPQ